MLVNGTVLGVVPVKASLLIYGAILTVLFTVMKPEVSAGLTLLPRFLCWSMHIGTGILATIAASYLVRMLSDRHFPLLIVIGATGIIGAMIAAPMFLVFERLFFGDPPDNWLDAYGARGIPQGILVEFIEVLPTFLLCWLVINMPVFFNKPQLRDQTPPDDPQDPNQDTDKETQKHQEQKQAFFESLPEIIGRDVVAISSDLHYLNVHTTLGKTLVLGSLKHCAEFFEEEGMVVHRSNWVAKKHVHRVFVSGNDAYCLMATGLKVPVSRSKRKDVKRVFGQGSQALHSCSESGAKIVRISP